MFSVGNREAFRPRSEKVGRSPIPTSDSEDVYRGVEEGWIQGAESSRDREAPIPDAQVLSQVWVQESFLFSFLSFFLSFFLFVGRHDTALLVFVCLY